MSHRKRPGKNDEQPGKGTKAMDAPVDRMYFDPSQISPDEIAKRIWDSRIEADPAKKKQRRDAKIKHR